MWKSVVILIVVSTLGAEERHESKADSLSAVVLQSNLPPLAKLAPPSRPTVPNFRPHQIIPAAPVERFRPARAAAVGTLTAFTNILAFQKFKHIWWTHPTTGFHFYRGWRQNQGWYDLGPDDSLWFHMDKFGHYYNARLLSLAFRDAAGWAGLGERSSLWAGALTSWLLMLEIELFDSRYQEWGFSIGDLLANTAGAMAPLLQKQSPTNKFTLKWSYHAQGNRAYWIDDYEAMTFWLCANPRDFFNGLRPFWPRFLNLSVGYGITQKAHGEIEWSIGLDYDLTCIAPRNPIMKKIVTYLNYIHFPAPSLRLTPHFRFDPFSF